MKAQFTNWYFGGYRISAPAHSKLEAFCMELQDEFPKLVIRHKRDVWWQWIIHAFVCVFTLFQNRKYINEFTTTGKDVIYLSDNCHAIATNESSILTSNYLYSCLRHERVHLRGFRDRGIFVMIMLWLFPPILFCYGRAIIIEKPAYLETMRADFAVNSDRVELKGYRDWWISQFTSSNYGWMWIIKSQVERWFDDELVKLQEMREI